MKDTEKIHWKIIFNFMLYCVTETAFNLIQEGKTVYLLYTPCKYPKWGKLYAVEENKINVSTGIVEFVIRRPLPALEKKALRTYIRAEVGGVALLGSELKKDICQKRKQNES